MSSPSSFKLTRLFNFFTAYAQELCSVCGTCCAECVSGKMIVFSNSSSSLGCKMNFACMRDQIRISYIPLGLTLKCPTEIAPKCRWKLHLNVRFGLNDPVIPRDLTLGSISILQSIVLLDLAFFCSTLKFAESIS